MNNGDRINIVPILAAKIANDGSIEQPFDEISFKENTSGEFYIDFLVSAIFTAKYLVKYLLVRIMDGKPETLHIDSFVIPPDEKAVKFRGGTQKEKNNSWHFGKGDLLSGRTVTAFSYDKISKPGEYGILAFLTQVDKDEKIKSIDLKNMELAAEKHFWVNITD